MNSKLKDLVSIRMLSLSSCQPSTLEFVLLAIDSITVNSAKEIATMPKCRQATNARKKNKAFS
jgi:hypothetical protein